MVWAHATSLTRVGALADLGQSLRAQTPDLHLLLTYDPALFACGEAFPEGCDWLFPLGKAGATAQRQMLRHWEPDVGIWTGGHLWTNLLQCMADTGTPLVLLDADQAGFERKHRSWFSNPTADALRRFDTILTANSETSLLLQRYGLPPNRIETHTPLRRVITPPVCSDEEAVEMAHALAGRPSWLAARVHPDEFGLVLSAHRAAVRLAHRLLLVILPEDPGLLKDLTDLLDGMTLRHATWVPGEPVDDHTQVLVLSDPEDLALWYRLAPQSFIGQSLVPGANGRCPMDAASLGSAVIFGPHVERYRADYDRLMAAGAARQVRDGNTLGKTVTRLMAPDRTAAMALAGWEVVTEGAELAERAVTLITGLLDRRGQDHASA